MLIDSGNGLAQIIFTKENVMEQLKRLKTDKSPGIYELHPKFLYEVREEIGEELAFDLQQVNADWRCTTGMERCPHSAIVQKGGNRSDPCNYRPVSLTSVVCKVMEKIVKDNVVEHLNESNVIKGTHNELLKGVHV